MKSRDNSFTIFGDSSADKKSPRETSSGLMFFNDNPTRAGDTDYFTSSSCICMDFTKTSVFDGK